jgi:endonuclease YncB( thermonuclease family)
VPFEFLGHNAPYVGGIYRGVVTHVIDGDTVDVLLDLGCNHYDYQTVRLAAINAPERGTSGGTAATNYVRQWLLNQPVIVRTVKDREKFGRYLGLLWIMSPSNQPILVNLALISEGHAVSYLDDGVDLQEEQRLGIDRYYANAQG